MSCLTKKFSLGLALVALAAGAPPAFAGPVTATFNGVGPGQGSAGQYNWTTAVFYPGMVYTTPNNVVMFCIERDQLITGGTTYTNYHFVNLEDAPVPGPAMTPSVADSIRAMWAQYRDTLDTGTAAQQNQKSAAFQEAIWKLLDPSYNPSLSGGTLAFYNTFLTPSSWVSGLADLGAMVNAQRQDQIFELQDGYIIQDGNLVPTPAPPALLVAAVLAPALLVRRRFARNRAA
jgi:hypothetical protein